MGALDELGITKKTIREMSPLEFAIWNSYNDGYKDAEQAAAELARLRAIEKAAQEYLNQTPESELEIARDIWGNSNTGAVLTARRKLAAALEGRTE